MFNLAVTVDPAIILIGGAISKNAEVIAQVQQRLAQLIHKKGAEGLAPVVKPCKFYNQANQKIAAAHDSLVEAHRAQTNLLTQEAQGNHQTITLLTVHSQDHLMTAIAFTDLAKEIIDLYQRVEVAN